MIQVNDCHGKLPKTCWKRIFSAFFPNKLLSWKKRLNRKPKNLVTLCPLQKTKSPFAAKMNQGGGGNAEGGGRGRGGIRYTYPQLKNMSFNCGVHPFCELTLFFLLLIKEAATRLIVAFTQVSRQRFISYEEASTPAILFTLFYFLFWTSF